MRTFLSVVSAVALIGGVALAASPSALAAAIPGCTMTVLAPSAAAGKKVQFGATASCRSGGTSRGLYAELWHNYDNWPDYPVTAWFDLGSKKSYNAVARRCDGPPQTTEYFTRATLTSIFDKVGVTKTSKTREIRRC